MQFEPRYFNPASVGEPQTDGSIACELADANGRKTLYVYDRSVVFAINVALAAGRPLLLAGEPGSGKTRSRVMPRAFSSGPTTSRRSVRALRPRISSGSSIRSAG